MNRERLKNARKKKSLDGNENESTEVFVLSPNMLQKLGIDLENVGIQPQDCPETSQTSITHCIENEALSNKNVPSMLQTANLMKKSVLLSPTFETRGDESDLPNDVDFLKTNFTNGAHPTLYEIDVTDNADDNYDFYQALAENEPIAQQKNLPNQIQGQDISKNILSEENCSDLKVSVSLHAKITKVNSSEFHLDNYNKSKDYVVDKNNADIDDRCLVSKFSVCEYVVERNKIQNNAKSPCILDVTNKSTLNRNAMPNHVNVLAATTLPKTNKVQMESNKKINSIKETLLDAMMQNEKHFEDSTPTEIQLECIDNLTAQDVETIASNFLEINTNVLDICSDDISVSSIEQLNEPPFHTKESLHDSSSKRFGKQLINTLANVKIQKFKDAAVDFILNSKNEETIPFKKSLKLSDNSKSFKQKNVATKREPTETNESKQTIRTYSRKKINIIGSTKNDTDNSKKPLLSVKTANNNVSTLNSASIDVSAGLNSGRGTSKLCIQGVEKPGGNFEIQANKIFRTYKRNKKPNNTNVNILSAIQYKLDDLRERKDDLGKIDCNEENIDAHEETGEHFSSCYKMGEYCLCSDFGAISYYDCNNDNEHRHFWINENIQCDLSTIFSIYEDRENFGKDTVTTDYDFDVNGEKLTIAVDTSSNHCTIIDCNQESMLGLNIEAEKPDAKAMKRTIPMVSEGSKRKKRAKTRLLAANGQENDGSGDRQDAITPESKKTVDLTSDSNAEVSKNLTAPDESGLNMEVSHIEKNYNQAQSDSDTMLILESKKTVDFTSDSNVEVSKNLTAPDESGLNMEVSDIEKNYNQAQSDSDTMLILESKKTVDLTSDSNAEVSKNLTAPDESGLNMEVSDIEKNYNQAQSDSDTMLILKVSENFTGADGRGLNMEVSDLGTNNDQAQSDTNTTLIINEREESEEEKESCTSSASHVTCGVCEKKIPSEAWTSHMGEVHDYLAWKSTEKPLENLIQGDSYSVNNSGTDRNKNDSLNVTTERDCSGVTCGVCDQNVAAALWTTHIGKSHNYLAWKKSETPLDLNDEEAVHRHLTEMSKLVGGLVCNKCGLMRKYGKKFLLHISSCTGEVDDHIKDASIKTACTEQNHDEKATTNDVNEISSTDNNSPTVVTCGVCGEDVEAALWSAHMGNIHNYIAWKNSDSRLDLNNEEALYQHLTETSKLVGGLVCSKCGLKRKNGKTFLLHIRKCTGEVENNIQDDKLNVSCAEQSKNESQLNVTNENDPVSDVTCGVCAENVMAGLWTTHMGQNHDYLAWKHGETPLDLNKKEALYQHLTETSKLVGGLVCRKCGLKRKYGKTFLLHVRKCTGEIENNIHDDTLNASCAEQSKDESFNVTNENDPASNVTCGVCAENIKAELWTSHMGQNHDYIAWKHGETPLDFNDEEIKNQYLKELIKKLGSLACPKCGLERRYVKSYLNHINVCTYEGSAIHTVNNVTSFDLEQKLLPSSSGEVVCGVCLKKIASKQWMKHKMEEHYNLAWAVGQTPIDFKHNYAIEKLLKEYKDKYHTLVCKVCKTTRGSAIGFFTHILMCGKTEEEIEACKITCERCDKKYFYVYQSQHLKWHAKQDYKDQIKKEAMEKIQIEDSEHEANETGGRSRKAARKAIAVIAKYKTEASEQKHVCEACGFGTNNKIEFGSHDCKAADCDFSDSGESAQIEDEDEDESSGNDEDEQSDASEDEPASDIETKVMKRRRTRISGHKMAKMRRMPFPIEEPKKYLLKSGEQYLQYHFSDEDLYPEWRQENYELMSEEEVSDCLPALEKSCKFKINPDDFITLKRFEAQYTKDISTLFVGGSMESVCWVPGAGNLLSVVCRRRTDKPRLQPHSLQRYRGIVQIWDFGQFNRPPKLAMSLCHDVGEVWAARWCPWGTQHSPLADLAPPSAPRLGLLALASSDGSAYIVSVPYPPKDASDKVIYKVTPIVELRLSVSTARKRFQATSLDWSPEKGHKVIVVGYADGTTAYYDLTIDSPLLRTKENNVIVLYPYHDERMLNTCVTDVSLCAGLAGSGYGAVGAASPTMAAMGTNRGARGMAVTGRLSSHEVAFMPHWPTALFAGDEAIGVGACHEVEWWLGARRQGWSTRRGACVRCAAVAAAAPPCVAILHPHPAHDFIYRKLLCSIDMKPLRKKRKKVANDNLGIQVEPTSYEDAAKKYGLEFKWIRQEGGHMPTEDPNVDRFPLCEVVGLQFCPAPDYHHKLAIATQAGLIFVVDTR